VMKSVTGLDTMEVPSPLPRVELPPEGYLTVIDGISARCTMRTSGFWRPSLPQASQHRVLGSSQVHLLHWLFNIELGSSQNQFTQIAGNGAPRFTASG
jgi:hypothetical protein